MMFGTFTFPVCIVYIFHIYDRKRKRRKPKLGQGVLWTGVRQNGSFLFTHFWNRMIKGNHSPAPVAMHETKEVVRGREETPRRRKLTGDDVIVVMSNLFRVENSIILIR